MANTRRCPEQGKTITVDRVPARGAARREHNSGPPRGGKRAPSGAMMNHNCTSDGVQRNTAQRTQREGAGRGLVQRSTARARNWPRTDRRRTRAWVRQPGRAAAGRAALGASLAQSSMCTGVGCGPCGPTILRWIVKVRVRVGWPIAVIRQCCGWRLELAQCIGAVL